MQIVFLLIVTPIFISHIELKDNTIVFKGSRIDDKITITEEKANDGVTLQLKANGTLIANEKSQDAVLQMKNIFRK